MASILAIENLIAKVRDQFAAEGTEAVQLFGWRAAAEHVEGDRVVWTPGDLTGKVGKTIGAKQPGRYPRSLGTLQELFTVSISAADSSNAEDEQLQYRAAWLLRLAWFRAVYHAAHGTYTIIDEVWDRDRKVRSFGATLQVVIALEAALLDVPPEMPTQRVVPEHAAVTFKQSPTGTPVTDVYPEE